MPSKGQERARTWTQALAAWSSTENLIGFAGCCILS